MSYFVSGRSAADAPPVIATGDDRREPIADGVTIERRRIFWLSAGSVAALLLGRTPLRGQEPAQQPAQNPAKLSFEQFLAEVHPLAKRLIDSGGEDEQAYLMTVAATLCRLRDPAAPLREQMQAFRKQHAEPGVRFPLAAVSMRLEAGRGFSHHDHLDYNGVILGVEGEVRIRNYDFVGEPPAIDSGRTFEVRQTRDDLILPGGISTLGRGRENVHDLVAGKDGARVLDVFTFFDERATSRYLDVDEKPRDAALRVHEASWRQPRRRRNRESGRDGGR